MQLRFAHDAGQAQKQAVVVSARIVEPLAIGEEHPEQGAQLKQLMPIAVVARQPGGIQADDQAGLPSPISAMSFWKPARSALPAPDLPRSSSMTWTRSRGQPSPTARSTRRYWSSVLS